MQQFSIILLKSVMQAPRLSFLPLRFIPNAAWISENPKGRSQAMHMYVRVFMAIQVATSKARDRAAGTGPRWKLWITGLPGCTCWSWSLYATTPAPSQRSARTILAAFSRSSTGGPAAPAPALCPSPPLRFHIRTSSLKSGLWQEMDLGRWQGQRFGGAYLIENSDVAIDTTACSHAHARSCARARSHARVIRAARRGPFAA